MPGHLEWMSRVYSEETWSLYRELDRSLVPRGPDWLHRQAREFLAPGALMLDAGCGDAAHLIRLVQANDVSGFGIDPVRLHVERARAAVARAGLAARIEITEGVLEQLPYGDGQFDFVWCRDVLEQVERLGEAVGGAARVLRRGGFMLAYTTVTTGLLEPNELAMLARHRGNVVSNLSAHRIETAFRDSSLTIVRKEVVGTEWREYAEERTQPVSRKLLQLARLRRRRDLFAERWGPDICAHVEANLHWEVFQFLGKLAPTIYVLRRD